MNTLQLVIPGGKTFTMQGDVCEENLPQVAAALDRELPNLARIYGRVTAVIYRDGVSHIITSRRAE